MDLHQQYSQLSVEEQAAWAKKFDALHLALEDDFATILSSSLVKATQVSCHAKVCPPEQTGHSPELLIYLHYDSKEYRPLMVISMAEAGKFTLFDIGEPGKPHTERTTGDKQKIVTEVHRRLDGLEMFWLEYVDRNSLNKTAAAPAKQQEKKTVLSSSYNDAIDSDQADQIERNIRLMKLRNMIDHEVNVLRNAGPPIDFEIRATVQPKLEDDIGSSLKINAVQGDEVEPLLLITQTEKGDFALREISRFNDRRKLAGFGGEDVILKLMAPYLKSAHDAAIERDMINRYGRELESRGASLFADIDLPAAHDEISEQPAEVEGETNAANRAQQDIMTPIFRAAQDHASSLTIKDPKICFTPRLGGITQIFVELNHGNDTSICLEANLTPQGALQIYAADKETMSGIFTGRPDAAVERLKSEMTKIRDETVKIDQEFGKFDAQIKGWSDIDPAP